VAILNDVFLPMAKEKKRRKQEADDGGDKIIKKKARKDKGGSPDDPNKQKQSKETSKKDKSRQSEGTLRTPSKSVHLDLLQSIFAPKPESDGVFTLFDGDLVTKPVEESKPPAPDLHLPSAQPRLQPTLYFFPHYDSPEKNALSLFSVPNEPFFHNRSEYATDKSDCSEEKAQIWNDTKYELTKDWKAKRKAALKMKRRQQIRRRFG
jgi:anthranilate/para-aminobenzoate synthase component I